MSAAGLKRFAVFADLSERERDEVAGLLEVRELSPGQTLFHEGEDGDGLVLVDRGALRLASARCGEEATVTEGASLGALSLVAVGHREVTATAAGSTRVLLLRRAGFRRLTSDAPRAACRLAETILADVASLARRALDRVPRPVDPDGADE